MAPIKRAVLDVLKPHQPNIVEFARSLSDVEGVQGVNATVVEMDERTQTLKLTIEGDEVNFDAVRDVVAELGGSVHSVDEIACGGRLVEESVTPQD